MNLPPTPTKDDLNIRALRIYCEELGVPWGSSDFDDLAAQAAMAFGEAAQDGAAVRINKLERILFSDPLLKAHLEKSGSQRLSSVKKLAANPFDGPIERSTPKRSVQRATEFSSTKSAAKGAALQKATGATPSTADPIDDMAQFIANLAQKDLETLRRLVLREVLDRELTKSATSPTHADKLIKELEKGFGGTRTRSSKKFLTGK